MKAELSLLDVDTDDILDGTPARSAFEDSFKQDVAAALGVSVDQVDITAVVAGSDGRKRPAASRRRQQSQRRLGPAHGLPLGHMAQVGSLLARVVCPVPGAPEHQVHMGRHAEALRRRYPAAVGGGGGAVAAASFLTAVLTEIYPCNVCSCHGNVETQRPRPGGGGGAAERAALELHLRTHSAKLVGMVGQDRSEGAGRRSSR
eukprot:COSAG01_NODE_4732_length_4777_cov_1.971624_4_plen_203_part_00